MKKITFPVFLFIVCLLFTNNPQLTIVSAQKKSTTSDLQVKAEKDRELAGVINRLTNRSDRGLAETRFPDGRFMLDLHDRFQNVMLARLDGEDVTSACVTSVDEANAFFGRNLETGEIVSSSLYQKDETDKIAARHGMSRQEFEFYKKLIEDAAIRRLSSPNLATINIVNNDGVGEGFNSAATPATLLAGENSNTGATLGAQRLQLFNFAAGIWGAFLDSNVQINIRSQFDSLMPCTTSGGVLGSAGAVTLHGFGSGAPYNNTWYPAALANKIAGADLDTSNPDINATFNSDVDTGCLGAGTRFYYGLNNSTPPGTINLLVVLLHEMGHGLGFQTFANGQTGTLNGGRADIYTVFMYDRSIGKYWSQMSDGERQISALNPGNVLWDGANVKIASGFLTAGRDASNGRVQLFTPNPFQSGSSISHFDTAATTNLLMEPVINNGLSIDLDLTRQQMRDIGWFRDTTADRIADTITNILPSGTTVNTATSKTITWTNNGGFNRNVTIELSTDGGANYSILASNVVNTGSYTFTVPNTTTTQAKVRVREYDFAEPAGISASNFTIAAAPTAAPVSVSGRVTDSLGRGISGARITITGNNGESFYAMSNPFGYFAFAEIESGETYIFEVSHKRFTFAPQIINLVEDLNNLTFTAQP